MNRMARDSWTERLPNFRGEVSIEGRWLDVAELDFGKVRRQRPLAVLRPANTEDVVAAAAPMSVPPCRMDT